MIIEKIVLDYLTSLKFKELVMPGSRYLVVPEDKILLVPDGQVLDVPCYTERPEEEPDRMYIVIEKTGSSETNHITDATMAIQSYGLSLYEAAVLNDKVKEAMRDIVKLPSVSSCELNSDYNFTYTAMKAYRYQAVFVITYYDEEEN